MLFVVTVTVKTSNKLIDYSTGTLKMPISTDSDSLTKQGEPAWLLAGHEDPPTPTLRSFYRARIVGLDTKDTLDELLANLSVSPN